METGIKMVAMDFDLTLVDYVNRYPFIPDETQTLLKDLILNGVEAGIVSGRYWWEMKDIVERAGMKWGDPFPSFFVTRETFIYWLQKDSMVQDAGWNLKHQAGVSGFMCSIAEKVKHITGNLRVEGLKLLRWILYSDYALELYFSSEEEAEKACMLLEEWMKDVSNARVHRNRSCANVVYSVTGKGKSLLRAAEYRKLMPQQVLAIGDSMNDLDMLDGRIGFLSGAVGNANDKIKEAVAGAGGITARECAGAGIREIIMEYRQRGFI